MLQGANKSSNKDRTNLNASLSPANNTHSFISGRDGRDQTDKNFGYSARNLDNSYEFNYGNTN